MYVQFMNEYFGMGRNLKEKKRFWNLFKEKSGVQCGFFFENVIILEVFWLVIVDFCFINKINYFIFI